MVSIARRMRKLQTLLAIRVGPGAALLPSTVSRLHLDFAYHMKDGHMGPRKFWRNILPRLKFHNPSIPMTVTRTTDNSQPATLSIFFRRENPDHDTDPSESSNPPPTTPFRPVDYKDRIKYSTWKEVPEPGADEELVTIDMKYKRDEDIMKELMVVTRAIPLEPTPGEVETMNRLEEQRQKSEIDATRSMEVRQALKKERDMLQAARGISETNPA